MASRGPQSTHWCFTVHDYTTLVGDLPPECGYIVYQEEAAPATGRAHVQGYIQFPEKRRGTTVSNLLREWFSPQNGENLGSVHSEPARGSDEDNERYCTKDETRLDGPYRHGIRVPRAGGRGGRSDLIGIKRKLDDGRSMAEIREDHFGDWIRYGKRLAEYRRISTAPRERKTKCFLFVGPAGTGKSTLMKLIAKGVGSVYKVPAKKGSGLYFDDYDGQDVMIVDEFDGNLMPPTFFNLLVDEHECVLPVHGGAGHQMVSGYIFIGSNYAPKYWWRRRTSAQLRQTTRRIDVVFKVGIQTVQTGNVRVDGVDTDIREAFPEYQLNADDWN